MSASNSATSDEPPSWFFTMSEDTLANANFQTNLRKENRVAWQLSNCLPSRINSIHRIIVPHVEWHVESCRFIPRRPLPLPKLHIKVELLQRPMMHFSDPLQSKNVLMYITMMEFKHMLTR